MITNCAQIYTGLLFYAYLCWYTPSEKTGLWQLPKVSSAFKTWAVYKMAVRCLVIHWNRKFVATPWAKPLATAAAVAGGLNLSYYFRQYKSFKYLTQGSCKHGELYKKECKLQGSCLWTSFHPCMVSWLHLSCVTLLSTMAAPEQNLLVLEVTWLGLYLYQCSHLYSD